MAVMEMSREAVTLGSFAARVGCHFSTVSRLKSGDRLPGRELLGRIVEVYCLDPREALTAYVSGGTAFGSYLCVNVFNQPSKELPGDDSPVEERVTV